MKKGISLTMLVIIIILMILVAGIVMFFINNSETNEMVNNVLLKTDEAKATSLLSMKYSEIIGKYYSSKSSTAYLPNDEDASILDSYVKEHTDNNFGVELNENNEYVIINLHDATDVFND